VVALGALGYTVANSVLVNNAGADSPEAAVRELAEAASAEDPLEALALLPPEEVSAMDDLFEATAGAAEDAGGVADADDALAGLDIEVDDLELEVEELSDDVARVIVRRADLSASVDPDDLADDLREQIEDEENGGDPLEAGSSSFEVSDDPDDDGFLGISTYDEESGEEEHTPPFVMTVRRDGRWFVSPLYTAAEYARLEAGLDEVDFDAEPSEDADGADDPEEAVQELVDAVSQADTGDTVSNLPPDQLRVAYDYEDAVRELVAEELSGSWTLDVTDIELDVEEDGDRAVVTIEEASGSYHLVDDDGDEVSTTFGLDGTCGNYSTTETYTYEEYDEYYDEYYEEYDEDFDDGSGCLDEALGSAAPDEAYVVTVRRDGQWYVSPIDTLLAYGQELVENGIVEDFLSGDLEY